MGAPIAEARRAFERRQWKRACDALREADEQSELEVGDLERLAVAAYLVGEIDVAAEAWARAFGVSERANDAAGAARCATWLAFVLVLQGQLAPASGWAHRALRMLDEHGADCAERGMFEVFTAVGHLFQGMNDESLREFTSALEIGLRHGDRDVEALARLGQGQSLLFGGVDDAEGVAALDEAMVVVTSGEVSPMVVGLVYCAVIEACHLIFDLRRAQEWTAALNRWCDSQPDLVPYRGQCLVHRAELLQFHGDWPDALGEAERAREHLSRSPVHPALGMALYRLAELHRLRGEWRQAEEAYALANERGHEPQPGLALLRLSQGHVDMASAAIRRALEEASDRTIRAQLLGAYVEIMVAAGDLDAAADAAAELAALAGSLDTPALRAISQHAGGLVGVARGDAGSALPALRSAWKIWRELDAPYEAARVRVAIGRACRLLGDEDGAALEFRAAKQAFGDLGAVDDLRALDTLTAPARQDEPTGQLSAREREVLALVATGMTNRAIAAELVISERTVARHVANIFAKLGVSSRAAATAVAYEQGLTTHN